MYTINWNVQTDKKNAKTPLQMCNRSKMVPENILKTGAVQVKVKIKSTMPLQGVGGVLISLS